MSNLSKAAQISWTVAAYEASGSGYRYIEKEHLLVGTLSIGKFIAEGPGEAHIGGEEWLELKEEYSLFGKVLRSFGIDQTALRRMVRKELGSGNFKHSERIVHRSEECKAIFDIASVLSDTSPIITTLHLSAAMLENPGNILDAVFSRIGADSKALKEAFLSPPEKVLTEENADEPDRNLPRSYLERFGTDLTSAARQGKIGPFVGGRSELLQVIQTLARSMKSNPVLVGEAGVGKTAIVEALALRCVQGKEPQVLSGKKIIELNLGGAFGRN